MSMKKLTRRKGRHVRILLPMHQIFLTVQTRHVLQNYTRTVRYQREDRLANISIELESVQSKIILPPCFYHSSCRQLALMDFIYAYRAQSALLNPCTRFLWPATTLISESTTHSCWEETNVFSKSQPSQILTKVARAHIQETSKKRFTRDICAKASGQQ